MQDEPTSCTRRTFLAQASAAGVTAGLIGIAGCSKGKKGPNCADLSGLTAAQKQTRTALKYVAVSTEAGKNCANCKIYNKPKAAGQCGGCQLFPGPVAEKGYCLGWQAIS